MRTDLPEEHFHTAGQRDRYHLVTCTMRLKTPRDIRTARDLVYRMRFVEDSLSPEQYRVITDHIDRADRERKKDFGYRYRA